MTRNEIYNGMYRLSTVDRTFFSEFGYGWFKNGIGTD